MTTPYNSRDLRLAAIQLYGRTDLCSVQPKTVAIGGAGTLGAPVLDHLAMLGVGLLVIDRGVVEPHNLGTQGFAASQVGQTKVAARLERIRQLNPHGTARGLCVDLEHLGLGMLLEVDIMLACLDSFAPRLVLNELAWRLNIPFVDAALDGSGQHLYGRVAVYDPRQPDAPCMVCSWDDTTYRRAFVEPRFPGCPTWLHVVEQTHDAPPTLAISSMAGIIGGLQTIQALRLLLGDTAGAGRELTIDVQHVLLHEATCRRNRRCRFDHRVWSLHKLDPGAWYQPVHTLFRRAALDLGGAVRLHPYRRMLATQLFCAACGAYRPIARFVHALQRAELCCACGSLAQPMGFHCLVAFDRRQATPFLNTTWQQLGLPANEVVTASTTQGREIHYIVTA